MLGAYTASLLLVLGVSDAEHYSPFRVTQVLNLDAKLEVR